MVDIAKDATVKSVGVVCSASSMTCADASRASVKAFAAGKTGPKIHYYISINTRCWKPGDLVVKHTLAQNKSAFTSRDEQKRLS